MPPVAMLSPGLIKAPDKNVDTSQSPRLKDRAHSHFSSLFPYPAVLRSQSFADPLETTADSI